MLQSHVIEVAGTFVGAAVDDRRHASGQFRFVAVDPRVGELDGSEWPTLPDLKRVVGHLLITGRLPPRGPGAASESAS
jgi:hypothetical protein